jgi:hypothetical protein
VRLPCPYLAEGVEWTGERERHISERHPELLPDHRARIAQTVVDPDEVRSDGWYDDLLGGKNVVVAVVSAEAPEVRHWIVTAFIARRPPGGDLEWKRL